MMNFTEAELVHTLRSLVGEQLDDTSNSLEALDLLSQAQSTLESLIEHHARSAKQTESWQAIGGALGMTKQAAHQRFSA